MARTKVMPWRQERRILPQVLRRIRNRQGAEQTYPYKIKFTLRKRETSGHGDIIKTVNRNNGDIIKTINVRRKSKYFSVDSARQF